MTIFFSKPNKKIKPNIEIGDIECPICFDDNL